MPAGAGRPGTLLLCFVLARGAGRRAGSARLHLTRDAAR